MKVAIAIILAALMISAAIAITGRYRFDMVIDPLGIPVSSRFDTWTGRVTICAAGLPDQAVCWAVDPSRVMAQQDERAAVLAKLKALQEALSQEAQEPEEALSD